MLMNIVPSNLNKIKNYQNLDYMAFREKLLEVFEEPDMATTYLGALAAVTHDQKKHLEIYASS